MFGAVLITRDENAGIAHVRSSLKSSSGSISRILAEPISASEIKYLRGETSLSVVFVRTERKTTVREPAIQSPRLVRKRLGRPVGAVISFRPMGRWQAESLHSSKITSGEKVGMQFVEKITLEQSHGEAHAGVGSWY